ncbi:FecR family protein [Olivibacter ginsenosidimutans]|uniref:FecR family protein n=1 Tax=Olivibacter ginsenosidimutans TaxID=1176537 RepID=A0ABP9ABD6_9SPHI
MEDINHLIEKFWQGKATTAEMEYLLAWLDHHGNDWKETLNKAFLEDIDVSTKPQWQDEQAQRLWVRINQAIEEEINLKLITEKKRKAYAWSMRVAASLILALIAAIILFRLQTGTKEQTVSTQPAKIFKTVNRDTTTIALSLPDQSIVKLSSASSIRYHEGFGISNRNIQLEGEAYFKVHKLDTLPFTVYANGIVTTALGTEFVVQTKGQEQVAIRLVSGKVVVSSQKNSGLQMNNIYLKPGEELNIDKKKALAKLSTIRQPAPVHSQSANQTERFAPKIPLHFEKEPLSQVFEQLSARFHRHFVYDEEKLKTIFFTGSYAPDDKLFPLLKAVSRMNGLDCIQRNGVIYIYPLKETPPIPTP